MIVDHVIVPWDGSIYTFPKRKGHVSINDARRSSTYVIGGTSGGRDPYGTQPFPKNITTMTYEFMVTPKRDHTTFDALRDKLNLAVDHGMPQTIYLQVDDGTTRTVTGKLIGKNLDVTKDVKYSAMWSLTWELVKPEVVGSTDGTGQWGGKNADGTTVKWGQVGRKWGQVSDSVTLNSSSVGYTLHNPNATAITTDFSIVLKGIWGPAGTPQLGVAYFSIGNSAPGAKQNGVAPQLDFAIALVNATDTMILDFGKRSITVNGLPFWSQMGRPRLQKGWLPLVPGDNPLVFTITGTPLGTLNATAKIFWKPKFGF